MTEKEKMLRGEPYDPTDEELTVAHLNSTSLVLLPDNCIPLVPTVVGTKDLLAIVTVCVTYNRCYAYFIRVLSEDVVVWRQIVIRPFAVVHITTYKTLQAIVTVRQTNELLANTFPIIITG